MPELPEVYPDLLDLSGYSKTTRRALYERIVAIQFSQSRTPRRANRTLVHLPTRRVIATLRSSRQCKELASELARMWVRWGGSEPAEDPPPVLNRHRREG